MEKPISIGFHERQNNMIIDIHDGSENTMNDNDEVYAPITGDVQTDGPSIEDELNEIEGVVPQSASLGDMMATGVVEMGVGDIPPMVNGAPQSGGGTPINDNTDPFGDSTDDFVDAEVTIVEPQGQDANAPEAQPSTDNSEAEPAANDVPMVPLEDYKKLEDRYDKLMADWDNYRKRSANEVKAAKASANKNLIETLIPTLDNFRLAATHVETQGMEPAAKGTIDGFIAIYRTVMTALEREGLKVIDPAVGSAFDMNEHQAVGKQADTDMQPDTIVGVVQVGYEFNGTVIRPAMVTVSV